MDTLEFLQSVLGDEGHYCIVGLKKGSDRPVQKFYSRIDDALAVAENLRDQGYDAYYALATFEDGSSRKTANVKQLRAMFLDLDCGPTKQYRTHADALKGLQAFCKAVQLPKPTLVNSGGGVHAYWPLLHPVTRTEWLPLAEQLKSLCEDHDLHADPVVTADSVRILRVPGTLNYKEDVPREVAILSRAKQVWDVATMQSVIGIPMSSFRTSYIPKGELDDATKAILGNYTNRFKTIILKTLQGNGCAQIRYLMENQITAPEPLWRAGLSVAKFCVDAEKAIHRLSYRHPEYDPDATDRKARAIKGGPYTCSKFDTFNPGVCDKCPNKGVVKSPIVLGREVQEATEEDNIVEDIPADIDQGHTQTYIIPPYPAPYFRGKTGGVYKRIIKEDDEVEVLLYHNDIYVTRRLEDAEVGEAVTIRLHLPKDGVREFTIPLHSVTSRDEFRKYMSARGVALMRMDDLAQYILEWVKHMQYTGKSDIARRQFGWVDDTHEAFVVGDKEVRSDRVDHNPPSTATAQMFHAFQSKGTLDTWCKAINFYNRPSMEMHQFVIGIAFGSIFTDFTAVNAGLLHLFSPESGIGKTTALIAGASIWGDPTKLMTKESDTNNSKMNRAELYRNIFIPMDELTNSGAKELSDYVYQFTSGMQRNRLTASANQERVRGEPWKLTGVSTGNTSILEKMSVYKAVPKGEAMRILELRATPVRGLDKADTDMLSKQLINNYGHAYLPYLQYVMSDIAGVKALYNSTQAKLDKLCGFRHEDRFHSVIAANGIMGLMLAKRVGLINFDIKGVVDWLVTSIRDSKMQTHEMVLEPEAQLTLFISENWNSMLRIRSEDDARVQEGVNIDHLLVPDATPKMQFVMRYEYDLKLLFIHIVPFRDWCAKRQINYTGLVNHLKNTPMQATIMRKRMGKGTRVSLPPSPVLRVNCATFMDEAYEEELNARHEAATEQTESHDGSMS